MKVALRLWVAVVILIVLAAPAASEPEKEEQLVYGVNVWNGTSYTGSFAPESEGKIYMVADRKNILNPVKTLVYFWPITGEYQADWAARREEFKGELEIRQNGRIVEVVGREKYTFVYPNGPYSSESRLVTGSEAETHYASYEKAASQFWEELAHFQKERQSYEKKIEEVVREAVQTGKRYSPEELPEPPEEPEPPRVFVEQVREAFVILLPEGKYDIRLIQDGEAVPGTDRQLIVYSPRRTGIGYILRPENKWTRPLESYEPTQFLYLEGRQPLFIQAFDVMEFPAFEYSRTVNPNQPSAGQGMEGGFAWVLASGERQDVVLQLLNRGKVVEEIQRRPYYVKQIPGPSLGYEIVEWNPFDKDMEGTEPSFFAFRIDRGPGTYRLRAVDSSGRILAGSEREIRTVKESGAVLWVMAFTPVCLGLLLRLRRYLSVSRAGMG